MQSAGSMSNKTKRIYLQQVTHLDRRIQQKFEQVEDLRSMLGKITATVSDLPMGGGSIYKGGDLALINKIVDLENEINRDVDRLIDLKRHISGIIEAVEDPRERELLVYRYLQGKTFEEIAFKMHYHWNWIHKLHSQALENLCVEVYIDKLI